MTSVKTAAAITFPSNGNLVVCPCISKQLTCISHCTGGVNHTISLLQFLAGISPSIISLFIAAYFLSLILGLDTRDAAASAVAADESSLASCD